MKKLLVGLLLALGLLGVTASPAEASVSQPVNITCNSGSETGCIVHGGSSTEVQAPAFIVEPGTTRKGKIEDGYCWAYAPAHSHLYVTIVLRFIPDQHFKFVNSSDSGHDYRYEKGTDCGIRTRMSVDVTNGRGRY
jgi:hypothetical protein